MDRPWLALQKVALPVFLGVLPVLFFAWGLATSSGASSSLAVDFHHELYPQTKLALEGVSPYPAPDADLSGGHNFVWPVAAMLLVAPLTGLPPEVADVTAIALVLLCLAGALWVLDVRDYRVYGVVLLWPPVLNAAQSANLTLPLCLLVALAWRYRARVWLPGVTAGFAIALKFFLWPLVIWLAAIRARRAALLACAIAAASLALVQAFVPIDEYVRLIRNLSDTFDQGSYTVFALLVNLGVAETASRLLNLAVGAGLLALAWRGRSFTLALAAALALSPIVWLHFFALLAIPIAAVRPRLHWLWFMPVACWPVPAGSLEPWHTALMLGVAATTLAFAARAETAGPAYGYRLPEPAAQSAASRAR